MKWLQEDLRISQMVVKKENTMSDPLGLAFNLSMVLILQRDAGNRGTTLTPVICKFS